MNPVRMDDRYRYVNRISCGGGFWPWFRGTPLKERLVSAVSGADSAAVSPQDLFSSASDAILYYTHLNISYSRFELTEIHSLQKSLTFTLH